MLFLWTASGIPFSIFFVSRRANIPIQIQPQMFTTLCAVTWAQSLYYPPVAISKKKIIAYLAVFVTVSGALEGVLIPIIRRKNDQGITWPALIFGILASVLLALGLIPPYFELWKRKGRVVGIDLGFLVLDLSGAVFSLLSLIFQEELDILGMVIYTIVACMEIGIMTSHCIWWFRFGRDIKLWEDDAYYSSEDEP